MLKITDTTASQTATSVPCGQKSDFTVVRGLTMEQGAEPSVNLHLIIMCTICSVPFTDCNKNSVSKLSVIDRLRTQLTGQATQPTGINTSPVPHIINTHND